jgi:hypothetical protein
VGPLHTFGEFVVTKFRDAAIHHADGLLAGRWKAPGLQALLADLSRLTAEQRSVVRRCVIESLDAGLHDFLFALSEAHDAGQGIAVVVDGQDVAALSDGLQGEPYSEEGWLARFSKYGGHADPA